MVVLKSKPKQRAKDREHLPSPPLRVTDPIPTTPISPILIPRTTATVMSMGLRKTHLFRAGAPHPLWIIRTSLPPRALLRPALEDKQELQHRPQMPVRKQLMGIGFAFMTSTTV